MFQPYRTPVKFNHTLFIHTKYERACFLYVKSGTIIDIFKKNEGAIDLILMGIDR